MSKNNIDINNKKIFLTKKNAIILLSVIVLSLLFSIIVSLFIPGTLNKNKKLIYINYGTKINKILDILYKNRLIRNKYIFLIYMKLSGKYKKVKAGEYEFFTTDSIFTISNKLVKGEVILHKIVIPEGSDIYDIAEILEKNNILKKDIFLKYVKDKNFLKKIGINYENAEGFLFPDTYNFVRGEPPEKIIKTMHKRFKEKVKLKMDKWYKIGNKYYSGYSILKIASIIEKEAKFDKERKKIASVFYNRLQSKKFYEKRLESCATVRYALQKKHGILTYDDLKVKSKYNTYIKIGLPPTPICNPGLKSIEAALNPEKTDYKYFVIKGDGTHIFSKTLNEHIKAKQRYKRLLKKGKINK